MEALTERMKAVAVTPPEFLSIAHPFHPPAGSGINFEVPRYLFRVYSAASTGENSTEGFASEDGSGDEGDLTDIFARNRERVALSLNEHLRWSRRDLLISRRDPFISWTTSIAFALHHAIYKSKEERVDLGEIMLCVIDTTKYPPRTFMQDLNLVRMFENSVPGYVPIMVYGYSTTWYEKGLGDFLDLRTIPKKRGIYYFGEYLSQGRTRVTQDHASIVSMDMVINSDAFQIAPQLQSELKSTTTGRFQRSRCAEAVLELRKGFHDRDDSSNRITYSQRDAGCRIASQFSSPFAVAVLANLLSLRPLWTPRTVGAAITEGMPDSVREFCLQPTRVVADETIPEVEQFQTNVRSIHEACYVKTTRLLSGYLQCHLGTGSTDAELHASMFGISLKEWAGKVVRDTRELRRKLEEVERLTRDSS